MEHQEMLDWEMIEDYGGELLDLFGKLGTAWTKALLSTDLTPYEREDYSAKLDVWWGEMAEYDESFGVAFRAVEQGWSHPPLVRVLEGEIPDDEFFDDPPDPRPAERAGAPGTLSGVPAPLGSRG
jgi:hypothetical protein